MLSLQNLLEDNYESLPSFRDLFEKTSQFSQSPGFIETAIVGGGPAGLLLALRLSKESDRAEEICLVEMMQRLGGRSFFSSPEYLVGMRADERFSHALENVKKCTHLSGFGFECYSTSHLEILERHIRAQLTEEEDAFLDAFVTKFAKQVDMTHTCYIVRKEFTSLGQLVSGSSETLTKHDAEVLSSLMKRDLSEVENSEKKLFGDSEIWKGLPKNRKDALTPILETILCDNFTKMTERDAHELLNQIWNSHLNSPTSHWTRSSGVELALEAILRKRGVKILLSSEVNRLNYIEADSRFRLSVANEVNPSVREVWAQKVCLSVPLARTLTLVQREWLTPAQSRFVAKVRPKSVVASEFLNFQSVVTEAWPTNVGSGTPLIFPVERVRAVVTSVGSLVFYTHLDFEESIHAPSVREALARVRRAAARIVRPEALKDLEPSLRIPNQHAKAERVVLMPVGYSVPFDTTDNHLKDEAAAKKGLFFCGDSFGYAFASWQNVVNSVQAVASLLSKEKY